MKGKFVWKVFFILVVIAVLALGSVAIYRMGFTHGVMTNISLPESGEYPMVPFKPRPLGWHAGSRIGLLGLFPLLCFGGFFFMLLMFGFGIMSRKRAWSHYGPGSHPSNWKHHKPPWGPGCPPWEQDQPEAQSETPPSGTDQTEG